MITAVGGFGGVAAVITAITQRAPRKAPDDETKPSAPPPGLGHVARSCLALGAGACLMASALVAVVGATNIRPGQIPIALLMGGAIGLAILTIWTGTRILRRAISEKQSGLLLYAGAGLIAACGALAAAFIAGTG